MVLDALAADVHTRAVGSSVAAALAGEPFTGFPTWDKVRAEFDMALLADLDEAATEDTPNAVMLRALGLR